MESKLDQRMSLIIQYTVTFWMCAVFGGFLAYLVSPIFIGFFDLWVDPKDIYETPTAMLAAGCSYGAATTGLWVCKLLRSEERLNEQVKSLKTFS